MLIWTSLIIVIGVVVLWEWLIPEVKHRWDERRYGEELDEPFFAEVLYHGEVVAELTEREFSEMFWRTYRITPRSEEARGIIEDDELWKQGVFEFRDPKTGNRCASVIVGGTERYVRDERIHLRGLYFRS